MSLCALVFCSVFATSFYSVYDWHWRCCAFGVTSCGFIDFTFALLLKIRLRFRGSFLRFHSMAYWTTRRCATSRIANSTTSQLAIRTARGLDKSRFNTTRGLDDSQHYMFCCCFLFYIIFRSNDLTTNYREIHWTDLRHIFKIDRTTALDD